MVPCRLLLLPPPPPLQGVVLDVARAATRRRRRRREGTTPATVVGESVFDAVSVTSRAAQMSAFGVAPPDASTAE